MQATITQGLNSTLLHCVQRQLVLLSLFDENCAQIINTSAGELLFRLPPVLPARQSPLFPSHQDRDCFLSSVLAEVLPAHLLAFSIGLQ